MNWQDVEYGYEEGYWQGRADERLPGCLFGSILLLMMAVVGLAGRIVYGLIILVIAFFIFIGSIIMSSK